MAYVTIPKDLTKVKSKVLFGLTKRQLICFGAAALIGVPLFFLLRRTASNSAAAFCMIIVMLPFFLLAMYERHGQPLEVVAGQIIRCMFLRMKERPYQTNNFYAALERQAQAEKEVKAIVQKAKAKATGTTGGKTRGKADRRRKALDQPYPGYCLWRRQVSFRTGHFTVPPDVPGRPVQAGRSHLVEVYRVRGCELSACKA